MELANKLVLGALVVSFLFILVGHICKDAIQSVLKKEIVTLENVTFDCWSVLHFLLFAFIGFVKPNYPLSFFTLGCLFEIFEDCLSSDENTKLVLCPSKGIKNIMCNGIQDGYWYGKADDIFSNLIGYIVGQSFRTSCF
jgi:hypothetical protein